MIHIPFDSLPMTNQQFVKKEEEERNDEMDDVYDNVIIAHDFDTVFAGL